MIGKDMGNPEGCKDALHIVVPMPTNRGKTMLSYRQKRDRIMSYNTACRIFLQAE